MKKYTTLLFDSDNTLLDFTKAEQNALKDTLTAHGIEYKDEIHGIYSRVNDSFWKAYERGEIEKSEIYTGRFEKLLEIIGKTADKNSFSELYIERLACYHFTVDKAVDTLKVLKDRGYDLHIVTNGHHKIQQKRLEDSKIKYIVNGVFVSEAVGAPKPEKEYFDYVFAHISEKDKSKILIIGDSLTSDISGGINAGIDTCWYNPQFKTADIKPTYEINNITDLIKML